MKDIDMQLVTIFGHTGSLSKQTVTIQLLRTRIAVTLLAFAFTQLPMGAQNSAIQLTLKGALNR